MHPSLPREAESVIARCHARATYVFEDSTKSHPGAWPCVRRSHFGVTKVLRLHNRETEIEPDPHDIFESTNRLVRCLAETAIGATKDFRLTQS